VFYWHLRVVLAAATGIAASLLSIAPPAVRAATEAGGSTGTLTITGPPDRAVIAISDPRFIAGARLGPADRAPALGTLRLIVSGTSTCAGSVSVNGSRAKPSAGFWTARVPVTALTGTALGRVTLTATAAGCEPVSRTVTLISLGITAPAENAQEPITIAPGGGAPAMPALNARLGVRGYPGGTARVVFGWTLSVLGETANAAGAWSGYAWRTTGTTTGAGAAWRPRYQHVVGGVGRLQVEAFLPGVADNPVVSFPRWLALPGTNPAPATAKEFVDRTDPADAAVVRHLVCTESGWYQFSTASFLPGNNGQPPIPGVPAGWSPNPGPGQPLSGYGAIGLAQLDPASLTGPDQYWNWQANLRGGIAAYQAKHAQALAWYQSEQARLDARLTAALSAANAARGARGLPRLRMRAITVPPLTAEQATLQAIRSYNGGDEFRFDADYVLARDGIDVTLEGTRKWRGGYDQALDGVPPALAGYWGPAPASLRLRQPWIALPAPFQGYVQRVMTCADS
jgi:hypothetical protein